MSLATLAKATSMSKSGLFAHFRSKEALQIAIIDEAERIFSDVVIKPSQGGRGLARLSKLLRGYVAYCAAAPFEGGCFFAAATHEFDGRPGAVRDRLATWHDRWQSELRAAVADGAGEVKILDVDAFLFEVNGLGLSANFQAQMTGGKDRADALGREAVDRLLQRVAS